MTIREEIKSFEDKIDLTKKFPHYFGKHTKILVWCSMVICFILLGVSFQIDGISKVSVTCPCDSILLCENPFYEPFCDNELCKKEFLQPCEVIGEVPSSFSKHLGELLFFVIALTFLINHIIYKEKRDK